MTKITDLVERNEQSVTSVSLQIYMKQMHEQI